MISKKTLYEIKKLEVSIKRAEMNKDDYALKIMEKEADIERLQEEMGRQDDVVAKCKQELEDLKAKNE
jgi:hypothetical protein